MGHFETRNIRPSVRLCLPVLMVGLLIVAQATDSDVAESLIIVYQTNITQSDSLIREDQNLIAESLNEYLNLIDMRLHRSQFMSSGEQHNTHSCDHGNSETTGDLLLLEVSGKSSRDASSTRSEWKLIDHHGHVRVSLRLTSGQTTNIQLSLCSVQSARSKSSPCAGGLFPNDEKCVAYNYGPDPIQVVDCHLPKGSYAHLVVLLIHGGFWRSMYNRSIENAVANDLLRFNLVVCNLDYRSVGNQGGYPNTFYDVANGADLLRTIGQEQGFRADRVIVVGHSAGGQLGGFITGRFHLKPDQPGYSADPLRPIAFVTQAGVNNMWDGCDQAEQTGSGAVIDFLGATYSSHPERYVLSSLAASSNASVRARYPSEFLPLRVPMQAITGSADITVPVTQTVTFAEQAKTAGDQCSQVIVDGEDHFVHLNPSSRSWNITRNFILSFL